MNFVPAGTAAGEMQCAAVRITRCEITAPVHNVPELEPGTCAKTSTTPGSPVSTVPPTIAYIRWKRANLVPSDGQIGTIRRYLWIEVALFPLLPAFAAAMARGYGEVGL